jgi:hypothetical protein
VSLNVSPFPRRAVDAPVTAVVSPVPRTPSDLAWRGILPAASETPPRRSSPSSGADATKVIVVSPVVSGPQRRSSVDTLLPPRRTESSGLSTRRSSAPDTSMVLPPRAMPVDTAFAGAGALEQQRDAARIHVMLRLHVGGKGALPPHCPRCREPTSGHTIRFCEQCGADVTAPAARSQSRDISI